MLFNRKRVLVDYTRGMNQKVCLFWRTGHHHLSDFAQRECNNIWPMAGINFVLDCAPICGIERKRFDAVKHWPHDHF